MAFEDLTGGKYGKLTVTGFSYKEGYQRYWNCTCDCGVNVVRNGYSLKRGIPSCGCNTFNNLFGTRYGKLLALGRVTERTSTGGLKWKCRCDCGKVVVVAADALRRGATKSCGCAMYENTTTRQTTHGMSRSKLYKVWNSMNMRCKTDGSGDPEYGGRGITVCEEWRNSFAKFYTDVGDCPGNKTLDRIDSNGNYEPTNVRWADRTTQLVNQRLRRDNSTGIKGISKLSNGKYQARLKVYGKNVLNKEYHSLEEAVEARRKAEDIYHKPLLDAK